ncbi:MAG TPA: CerR family C-terminal domain-containing protein [Candidatus Angelobacter sp.]|nr:CerR family C-terminal domain-containing protein [Candidatus Angelobacter sp.]
MSAKTLARGHRQERRSESPAFDPTPGKLIEAAGPVFAEHGFRAATVREICSRAGTNVAAVNYHFGDKLGLYTAVLKESVRASKVSVMEEVLRRKAPPEELLRALIKARVQTANRAGLPDWHFRILIHEMAQPTPAMSRVFQEIGRPIFERMLGLIGTITGLPPHDEKTRLCAYSIMGQVFLYIMQGPFLARIWPELKMTPEQLDRIAGHIADFSLAYLHSVAAELRAGKQGVKNGKPANH